MRTRLAIVLAFGCSATALAQPPPARTVAVPAGVRVDRDLVYARRGDRAPSLDLHRPETSAGPLPVVVWLHGGGAGR